MSWTVLLVDDEPKLIQVLQQYLEKEGFRVRTAGDGPQALAAVAAGGLDLVVLDLMLPGMDGFEICRVIRAQTVLPIIMLTAKAEEADKLVGLELGADDYVTKPFSVRELTARIRAVLRRIRNDEVEDTPARYGDLEIDFAGHEVRRSGEPVALTSTEFKILSALAERPGRVFSRLQLLTASLGEAYAGYERSIDTHVSNLRRKLEPDPANPRYVLTVFGLGYKFGAKRS